MTLTEEQREAIRAVSDLPRAIGCTRCHNYIQKNYSNQFAVLRSMIDNKDYVPNAAELIELLAAGEHEQWADWAQSILDSEPGLSEGRKAAWPGMIATPYENLSEELKDKDRREVYLRSGDALAEIERLQSLRSDIITVINRPQTITDKGLLMYIRDEVDVNMRQAAKIQELETDMKQSERVIEAKLDVIDQQAARISDLEIEITGLKADLEQSEEIKRLKDELENYGDHYACLLISKDAQIKELEGMLSIRTEELDIAHSVARSEKEMHEKELAAFARRIKELEEVLVEMVATNPCNIPTLCDVVHDELMCPALDGNCDFWKGCPQKNELREAARKQLQAEGKIGSGGGA